MVAQVEAAHLPRASLREAAGLTQQELAERAGLSTNGIGALERGERQRPYPHTPAAQPSPARLTPEPNVTPARRSPPASGRRRR